MVFFGKILWITWIFGKLFIFGKFTILFWKEILHGFLERYFLFHEILENGLIYLFIYLENLFNVQCKPLPWESGYIQHIYLYYNVKPNFLTFGWPHHVASHKFLKSHNFTPHYFNIYFLIEFQFYSIIKLSIRILTHHIFFNIRIYYSIYKTQS